MRAVISCDDDINEVGHLLKQSWWKLADLRPKIVLLLHRKDNTPFFDSTSFLILTNTYQTGQQALWACTS